MSSEKQNFFTKRGLIGNNIYVLTFEELSCGRTNVTILLLATWLKKIKFYFYTELHLYSIWDTTLMFLSACKRSLHKSKLLQSYWSSCSDVYWTNKEVPNLNGLSHKVCFLFTPSTLYRPPKLCPELYSEIQNDKVSMILPHCHTNTCPQGHQCKKTEIDSQTDSSVLLPGMVSLHLHLNLIEQPLSMAKWHFKEMRHGVSPCAWKEKSVNSFSEDL